MKAEELPKPHKAGESDYCRSDLRGRSFKDKDLRGANFSYADIQGANFSGAKLIGANFSHTQAGLQHHWAIGLVIFSSLLLISLGFISAASGAYVARLLNNNLAQVFAASVMVAIACFCLFTIIHRLSTLSMRKS